MSITFPSKKQLDEQRPKYNLLPQDDYTLKIVEVKPEKQKKWQSEEMEDIIRITFEILSLKDGSTPVDEKEEVATGRKMFFTARPNSMGFMRDGTPSKTRQLVAYVIKQDVFENFEIESWDELLDEIVDAEIIVYVDQKGEKRNKIGRFLMPKKTKDDIPVIEEEEIDPKDIPF